MQISHQHNKTFFLCWSGLKTLAWSCFSSCDSSFGLRFSTASSLNCIEGFFSFIDKNWIKFWFNLFNPLKYSLFSDFLSASDVILCSLNWHGPLCPVQVGTTVRGQLVIPALHLEINICFRASNLHVYFVKIFWHSVSGVYFKRNGFGDTVANYGRHTLFWQLQ